MLLLFVSLYLVDTNPNAALYKTVTPGVLGVSPTPPIST